MAAQPLDDVLSRTREFHDRLAQSLDQSADKNQNTRAELLLEYLRDHEQKLSDMLKKIQDTSDEKELNTWYYEFTQKHNVIRSDQDHKPFSQMDADEIMAEVMDEHKQIIELYRYLYGRTGTAAPRELLQQLIDLEQHEAMLLSQEGQRTDEM